MAVKGKKEEGEIEVLTPEVVEEINTSINTALITHNVTDTILQELKDNYMVLIINGQSDKEGYNTVSEARKRCKNIRVLAKKICEAGRAKANAEAQKWIDKQKSVIAQIEEVEDYLEKQEKEWEAERDRLKEEKRQQEENRRMARAQELTRFGARYEDGRWLLRGLDYEDTIIREADEDVYGGIRDEYKAIFDENEKARVQKEEKEEKERLEMAKMRKERRGNRVDTLTLLGMKVGPDALTMDGFGMHFNDTHMEMLLDGDSDYWAEQVEKIKARITQSKEEEGKKAIRSASAKEKANILKELDIHWSAFENAFIGWDVHLTKERFDKILDGELVWEDELVDVRSIVADRKEKEGIRKEREAVEAEEIRKEEFRLEGVRATARVRINVLEKINTKYERKSGAKDDWEELGEMSEEEWNVYYDKMKSLFDEEQRKKANEKKAEEDRNAQLKKEQELAEAKDVEKYQGLVKYLLQAPRLEFKSGPYRTKARIIYDLLDGLK